MVLPSTITRFIYAQPLPILGSLATLTDDCVWDHHAIICSIKSAYHSFLPKSNEATWRTLVTWSWIWKLKMPPKIQLFIWKCAHHRIPTKSIIFPHVALSDQVCARCNEIETPIHVLHDFHFARHIWSPLNFLISDFFRLELHAWYKLNSKLNSPSCCPMEHYFRLYHIGNLIGSKFFDIFKKIDSFSYSKTKRYLPCHGIFLP